MLVAFIIGLGVYPALVSDVFREGLAPIVDNFQNPGLLAVK